MNSIPILDLSKGLKLDVPSHMIEGGYTADCLNVIPKQGEVAKRNGFEPLSNQQLNGDILAIRYWKRLTFEKYLTCFTTKDAYKWMPATLQWEFITPIYAVGSVTVTNGSVTVTGVGTLWLVNTKVGDIFKTADGLEYIIQSVNSNTSITLTSVYIGTSEIGVAYTIRKLFTCSLDDSYSFADMTNLLIVTNGVDNIYKWSGVGNLELLGGATDYKAKLVIEFENHLHLLNIHDGGFWCPQRVRRSDVGNPEIWNAGNAGFVELVKNSEAITQVSKVSSVLTIYKENSITTSRWLGSPSLFSYDENVVVGVGIQASKTLQTWRNVDYFLSKDGVFSLEYTSKLNLISSQVNKALIESISPEYWNRCNSIINYDDNTYWLISTYDNVIWILNLETLSWTKASYNNITGCGSYIQEFDPNIDGLVGTIDEQNWKYDAISGANIKPIMLFGVNSFITKYSYSYYKDTSEGIKIILENNVFSNWCYIEYIHPRGNLIEYNVDWYLDKVDFYVLELNPYTGMYISLHQMDGALISAPLVKKSKLSSEISLGWNSVNIEYELQGNQPYVIVFQAQSDVGGGWYYRIGRYTSYPIIQQYPLIVITYEPPTNSYIYIYTDVYTMMTVRVYGRPANNINAHWTTHNLVADLSYLKVKNNWMKVNYEAKGTYIDVFYSIDAGLTWTFLETKPLTSAYLPYYSCLRVTSPSIMFKFGNNNSQFDIRWVDVEYIKRSYK